MTLAEPGAKHCGHSAGRTGNLSPQDGATLWDLEERFNADGPAGLPLTVLRCARLIVLKQKLKEKVS
jgi:hypothetical protein